MAEPIRLTVGVEAPPERLWAVIVDYVRYPEFLSSIKKARLLSRDGARAQVAFEVKMFGRSIPYTLSFEENPPTGLRWSLVESSVLKENTGSWTLAPEGAGTQATYAIQLQIGSVLPQFVTNALTKVELPKILKAFKVRAEAPP